MTLQKIPPASPYLVKNERSLIYVDRASYCQHQQLLLLLDCPCTIPHESFLTKKRLNYKIYGGELTPSRAFGGLAGIPKLMTNMLPVKSRGGRRLVLPNFTSRGRLALPDFCGLYKIPDSKWLPKQKMRQR